MKKTINRPTINTIGADRYFKIGTRISHFSGVRGVVSGYSWCEYRHPCSPDCSRIRVLISEDNDPYCLLGWNTGQI